MGWKPALVCEHMSSLPKPTSEAPRPTPLERPSAEDVGPDERRSAAPHWQTPLEFAIHACVGTLLFGIVAASAILLDWGMEWVQSVRPIDPIIILGLRTAGYAIFGADLFLFLTFLLRTVKRTMRSL